MIVIDTKEGMEVYSWASLKMGIRLEMVGLKVSRKVNACQQAREALGVKTRDKAKLLAMVEEKLAESKQKVETC